MRSFGREFLTKVAPLFQQMAELDQEIHVLFNEIFTTKKFGKQTLKKIEAVYRNLQMVGVISVKPIFPRYALKVASVNVCELQRKKITLQNG
jgi:hypothetical protein